MKWVKFGFPGILVVLCGFSSLWCLFDWNGSYLGFLGIIWRTCGSKWQEGSGGIFLMLCVEFCLVLFLIQYLFLTKLYVAFKTQYIPKVMHICMYFVVFCWWDPALFTHILSIFSFQEGFFCSQSYYLLNIWEQTFHLIVLCVYCIKMIYVRFFFKGNSDYQYLQ